MRYERGSLLLTSNKHVRCWPEIFAGDEILTTAVLDRLLHHVAVVHIDGQSYRPRELGALLSPNREVPRGPDGRPNDPRSGAGLCLSIRGGNLGVLAQSGLSIGGCAPRASGHGRPHRVPAEGAILNAIARDGRPWQPERTLAKT
jgi:hypothetical protein